MPRYRFPPWHRDIPRWRNSPGVVHGREATVAIVGPRATSGSRWPWRSPAPGLRTIGLDVDERPGRRAAGRVEPRRRRPRRACSPPPSASRPPTDPEALAQGRRRSSSASPRRSTRPRRPVLDFVRAAAATVGAPAPRRPARHPPVDDLPGHHHRDRAARSSRPRAACAPASTSTSRTRPSASIPPTPPGRSPTRRRSAAGSPPSAAR